MYSFEIKHISFSGLREKKLSAINMRLLYIVTRWTVYSVHILDLHISIKQAYKKTNKLYN